MTRAEAERVAARLVTVDRLGPTYLSVRIADKEANDTWDAVVAEQMAAEWRDAIVRALVAE